MQATPKSCLSIRFITFFKFSSFQGNVHIIPDITCKNNTGKQRDWNCFCNSHSNIHFVSFFFLVLSYSWQSSTKFEKRKIKGLFTWSGGPRTSGVGFFCFHAVGDTKQKELTPLDRGPPLHVNRVLEVLIGLIVWIPLGQQMRMSFVLTNSGSILSPHSLRWWSSRPTYPEESTWCRKLSMDDWPNKERH